MSCQNDIGAKAILALVFYIQFGRLTCLDNNNTSTVYVLESEGQLCSPILQDFGETTSSISCAINCDLLPSCAGVFHSNTSRSCYGVDDNLSTTAESCSSEAVNGSFKFYRNSVRQITTAGLKSTAIANRTCQTDDDCNLAFPNTDCRQEGVCTCVAGFSLVPATNTCVTSCPGAYGDSFTPTIGFVLFKVDAMTPDIDRDSCRNQCIRIAGCASWSYTDADPTCYISTGTKHGNQHSWEENSNYEYYQRNCA